jgi:hypothetical protein
MTINLTPRKCLGYRSPVEAFLSELGRDVEIGFARAVALRDGIHRAFIAAPYSRISVRYGAPTSKGWCRKRSLWA